jgi:hypothetical protein
MSVEPPDEQADDGQVPEGPQGVLWLTTLCLISLVELVVFPAVSSSKPSPRKTAPDVLDRITRWRL